jgi:DNA-binding Lrp family transcriptional regulator
MKTETRQRLPRFKRTWSEELAFRLQDRDREILKWVYDCRLLTSRQINRLVSGSDQWILRRLQRLFHHGYLDRVKTASFNEVYTYGIGNKGIDELVLRYAGIDRGKADWTTNNREVKERHVAHTLMAANFRVALTLAVQERPETKIITWIPDGGIKEKVGFREERKGKEGEASAVKRELPVNPDGFIAIEDQGDELFFMPEFDRSSMTDKRFFEKLRGFWHWWKQGGHRSLAWSYWNDQGQYIHRAGINNFRVVTLTKSEERAENLRRMAKHVDDKRSGSDMFLFASEERFDPGKPASILAPIWQTPKDNTWHSLLE